MLWKVYVWLFLLVNAASLVAFDYRDFEIIPFASLLLSALLNIAVFSYAYHKQILPKAGLVWLFKMNVAMYGLFLLFEFLTFMQELIGIDLLHLPTSGVVSIIAGFPSLPALYATYKMAFPKIKKKSKRKNS